MVGAATGVGRTCVRCFPAEVRGAVLSARRAAAMVTAKVEAGEKRHAETGRQTYAVCKGGDIPRAPRHARHTWESTTTNAPAQQNRLFTTRRYNIVLIARKSCLRITAAGVVKWGQVAPRVRAALQRQHPPRNAGAACRRPALHTAPPAGKRESRRARARVATRHRLSARLFVRKVVAVLSRL